MKYRDISEAYFQQKRVSRRKFPASIAINLLLMAMLFCIWFVPFIPSWLNGTFLVFRIITPLILLFRFAILSRDTMQFFYHHKVFGSIGFTIPLGIMLGANLIVGPEGFFVTQKVTQSAESAEYGTAVYVIHGNRRLDFFGEETKTIYTRIRHTPFMKKERQWKEAGFKWVGVGSAHTAGLVITHGDTAGISIPKNGVLLYDLKSGEFLSHIPEHWNRDLSGK